MNLVQESTDYLSWVSDLKKEAIVQDRKRTNERQSGFNKTLHLTRRDIGLNPRSLYLFHFPFAAQVSSPVVYD